MIKYPRTMTLTLAQAIANDMLKSANKEGWAMVPRDVFKVLWLDSRKSFERAVSSYVDKSGFTTSDPGFMRGLWGGNSVSGNFEAGFRTAFGVPDDADLSELSDVVKEWRERSAPGVDNFRVLDNPQRVRRGINRDDGDRRRMELVVRVRYLIKRNCDGYAFDFGVETEGSESGTR